MFQIHETLDEFTICKENSSSIVADKQDDHSSTFNISEQHACSNRSLQLMETSALQLNQAQNVQYNKSYYHDPHLMLRPTVPCCDFPVLYFWLDNPM